MPEGTNGDPRGELHATWVDVTSPLPPGRIAIVGPARPDDANTRPWPTTGVGMTSNVMPRTVHNSFPVCGSYATTRRWLLTINSSRVPVLITTAVPQPTFSDRGVIQTCLPVFLSKPATNADWLPSW